MQRLHDCMPLLPRAAGGARGGRRRGRHHPQQPDHLPHHVRLLGLVAVHTNASARHALGRFAGCASACSRARSWQSARAAAPAGVQEQAAVLTVACSHCRAFPAQAPGRLPVWAAVGVEPVRRHAVQPLCGGAPADVHRCACCPTGASRTRWPGRHGCRALVATWLNGVPGSQGTQLLTSLRRCACHAARPCLPCRKGAPDAGPAVCQAGHPAGGGAAQLCGGGM